MSITSRAHPSPISDAASRRLALNALCFGFFLVVLDTTALNLAADSIRREWSGSVTELQWVVNSYTLVFAAFLLSGGALGDRLGARCSYELGLVVFTIASLLCSVSPGLSALVALRALQGLGAAVMLPASLSVLAHIYPTADGRSQAVGHWATVVSLAFAVGPILGGIMTHFLGWRGIFAANVPVGIVALAMVRAWVPPTPPGEVRPISWRSQLLASAGLFCMSFALIEVGGSGWQSERVWCPLLASVVLSLWFIRADRRYLTPLLPPLLFADVTFSMSVGIGLVLNFGVYGILFAEPLYLQDVRHFSALASGVLLLPLTVVPTLTTRVMARHSTRHNLKLRLVLGLLLGMAGGAVLCVAIGATGPSWTVLGLFLMGASLGFVMPAITTGALATAPMALAGRASSILNAARQVGGSLGVALMGSLFQARASTGLRYSFGVAAGAFAIMAWLSWRRLPVVTDTPAWVRA